MKTASPALINLLNNGTEFYIADLYTITLLSGSVARYTGADADVFANENLYTAGSLRFERDKVRTTIGVEVDSLTITIYAADADLLGGVPFLQACRNGALDQANLRLEYAVMENFGDTSAGTILQFSGRVADVEVSRLKAKLTVKSDTEILNVQMPRNLYQAGCMNTIYDSACGLSKAEKAVFGRIAGSTLTQIRCDCINPANYFTQGMIVFTSGVNNNVTRAVKAYEPGLITLGQPLVSECAIGDTFTVYPGCDKTQATCSGKFNNVIRFRGFPYIPAPETAT